MVIALAIAGIILAIYKLINPTESKQIFKVNKDTMFQGNEDIVKAAKQALARKQELMTTHPSGSIGEPELRRAVFDIDIAVFLLLCSALVYDRDDDLVAQALALETAYNAAPEAKRDPSVPKKIADILAEAQLKITNVAKTWGVQFKSVTELNASGGPFGGYFYSGNPPFVVVVFKGTTPNAYTDFLIDASIARTDARPFLWGQVHQGFYSALFPDISATSAPRSGQGSPYGSLIVSLQHDLADIAKQVGHPVNVWVAGHSLGAALGSIFFSRLVKCPEDLGASGAVANYYGYGCPATGDPDYAAGYISEANLPYTPLSPRRTLFRIIHDLDIVPRLPPGIGDALDASRYLSRESALAWSHIGTGLVFYDDDRPPALESSGLRDESEIVVVGGDSSTAYGTITSPPSTTFTRSPSGFLSSLPAAIKSLLKHGKLSSKRDTYGADPTQGKLLSILPPCISDHVATAYYQALINNYDRLKKPHPVPAGT